MFLLISFHQAELRARSTGNQWSHMAKWKSRGSIPESNSIEASVHRSCSLEAGWSHVSLPSVLRGPGVKSPRSHNWSKSCGGIPCQIRLLTILNKYISSLATEETGTLSSCIFSLHSASPLSFVLCFNSFFGLFSDRAFLLCSLYIPFVFKIIFASVALISHHALHRLFLPSPYRWRDGAASAAAYAPG